MDSLPYTATVINTSWSFSVISKEKTVWDLETRQERIINAHVNSFFHVCFHDLLKEQESRDGFQLSCWTSSSESSNFKSRPKYPTGSLPHCVVLWGGERILNPHSFYFRPSWGVGMGWGWAQKAVGGTIRTVTSFGLKKYIGNIAQSSAMHLMGHGSHEVLQTYIGQL